jgi:hypothetical protein
LQPCQREDEDDFASAKNALGYLIDVAELWTIDGADELQAFAAYPPRYGRRIGGCSAAIDNLVECGGQSLRRGGDSDTQQKPPSGFDGVEMRHVGLEPTTR